MPRSLSAPPETLFLGICLLAGTLLTALPYEELAGSLVPTVLFRGRPAAFHTFLLALLFTLASSASAIAYRSVFLGYSRLCRRAAAASLLVACAALAWSSFCWGLVMCAASLLAARGGFMHGGRGKSPAAE